jgi:hypothetical protein
MKKVLVAGLAVAVLSGAVVSVDLTGSAQDAAAMNKSEKSTGSKLNAGESKGMIGDSGRSEKGFIIIGGSGERAIIIIGGKIARIAGKMVTVNDKNGTSRTFEVRDRRDLKAGDTVNVKNGSIEKINGPHMDGSKGNKAGDLPVTVNKAKTSNESKGLTKSSGATTTK